VIVASIVVPLVVASLFRIKIAGIDTSFLPPMYATINGIMAIVLVFAVISIKKGNQNRHQKLMTTAVVLSILFLVGYVTYHITSDSTLYGDVNHDHDMSAAELDSVKGSAMIYYVILISHILLSVLVIPLVMMTYLKGWAGNIVSHKKWAKKTFPVWLYVAVSGVVVYLMIRPYY